MKKILVFLSLIAVFGYLFYIRTDLFKIYNAIPAISGNMPQIIRNIEKEISAPHPLRVPIVAKPSAVLTRAGVIARTNIERNLNGALPALKENTKLNAAAEIKLKDMFAGQYFEHVSPLGVGPGDLADKVGYEFILSGENLALGNFDNDKVLVTAWMDSPGHRANILNNKYLEIGVAVGKGMFEGHETWLAVQEFGFPTSACPEPNTDPKVIINENEISLSGLKLSAEKLRADLEASDPKTKQEYKEYNQKVDEYNVYVRQINVLIEELKLLVNNYNIEVNKFNKCAAN